MHSVNLILLVSRDFIMQQQEAGKASVMFHQGLRDNGIRDTLKANTEVPWTHFLQDHSSTGGKWGHSGQCDLQYTWGEEAEEKAKRFPLD